jgi:hypothetical protein
MSQQLTQDADLIYQCIGGEAESMPAKFEHGVPSFAQVILNEKVTKMPPERFTEAVHFLVRMEMVHLIQSGKCSCGAPRYDVVPIDQSPPPPFSCPDEQEA